MSTSPSPRQSDATQYGHTSPSTPGYRSLAAERTSAGAALVGLPPAGLLVVAAAPALVATVVLTLSVGVGFLTTARRSTGDD